MKAYVIEQADDHGLDAIKLAEVPIPAVGPGQVLVKVHAVGLNPVDYKLAEGGDPDWSVPHTLGLDVAGEIAAIGPDVSEDWHLGMRVAGHMATCATMAASPNTWHRRRMSWPASRMT